MSVQDQTAAATTVDATEAPAEATHGVLLTDVAAAKVKSLLEQEGRDDLRLRVGVQPGGSTRRRAPALRADSATRCSCSAAPG